jgi:hypothetical protein
MVFRLLRLERRLELPGPNWAGWYFSRGALVTPEGRSIEGYEGSWWSLLVRQARSTSMLQEQVRLLRAASLRVLSEVAVAMPRAAEIAGLPVVRSAPVWPASEASRLIYLKNTSRQKQQNDGLSPSLAIKPVAEDFTSWKGANYGC